MVSVCSERKVSDPSGLNYQIQIEQQADPDRGKACTL